MIDFDEDTPQRRLDLGLWRRILVHARPHRRHLTRLAGFGVLVASIESFMPYLTGRIMNVAAEPGGTTGSIVTLVAIYFGLATVISVCVFLFIVSAGRAVTGTAHDLRRAAFDHLQALSFSFYDTRATGWLMARLTSDVSRLAQLLPWFLLDLVWGSTLLVTMSVIMLVINVPLALVVMLVVPILAIVSWYFQGKLIDTQRRVRKVNSRITASFNEGIVGVRTTKTLVRERENLREFQVQTGEMYTHSVRNALQSAIYMPLVVSVGSLGTGLALWRGGVQHLGGVPLGELVMFMQFAALFSAPIQEIAARFTELQGAQASAERIQELLDTAPDIVDSEVALATPATELPERVERIEFRDVSFHYKTEEPILRNFDLVVEPGTSVALVGATGSGKTTIISLLARFYEPTSGQILIDGVDYRDRPISWWQSRLGIVLQSPHLFSGTIRENIRYGRLAATDEEVERAAQQVGADRVITALEHGYDTEVGESGARLSAGQRQLVSLARAVLADPQVLILDEATASVDTESERLIQQGVDALLAGRSSFVIAHRLSTIENVDRILVIDRGRIVESGNHRELLERGGAYAKLHRHQFRDERTREALASPRAS